ncbi:epididymal secretory E1 [Brachionus plicatilis]|uniref:Epididymal secretory E1 n=1 Tax=Brachionus plicatilis TaxID=10195 RepID=A0A3M7SHM8_BRAPC|nr:epididymal secretory E1 [Brachionus plicatilis]
MIKIVPYLLILIVFSSIDCRRPNIDFSKKEEINFDKFKIINDIYKDCGSETGSINKVTITDCTQSPCVFTKGKNYTLVLEFTSKVDTTKVVNHVYGIVAKIPVPFPLPNGDGCTLGINCPVKSGDSVKESVTLPVLQEYPKISLFVKWQVMDQNNKQMICLLFPVSIKS